jgi:hypothetical protein
VISAISFDAIIAIGEFTALPDPAAVLVDYYASFYADQRIDAVIKSRIQCRAPSAAKLDASRKRGTANLTEFSIRQPSHASSLPIRRHSGKA